MDSAYDYAHEVQLKTGHRDHIIINLGVEHYWISIVEECDDNIKELALCHLLDSGIECVPLNRWFDSDQPDCEVTIELGWFSNRNNMYRLGDDTTEAELISIAISKATSYVYMTKTIAMILGDK